MNKGLIIFLNGTSSSGKTSLTKKLQELCGEPYFHLSIDVYENMAPEKYLENNYWDTLRKCASAMHNSIKTFSDAGLNVIIDHVILDIPEENGWLEECVKILLDYPVVFVRVDCPLHELERREKDRGDRDIGQAKWQLERIHGHGIYDLEVNTFENTMQECAEQIMQFKLPANHLNAFRRLYEKTKEMI
ncbi:chloramphenicol phosphotransferase CPT family protein [Paenibacillus chibensis]|uniref:chloramphenicol phosphotransferase CPT family protein n=1 Tax=Paenibacillus chibensis TaxID=59846 RepID=UPI000FD6D94C|nr:AAA family ATPase [Paenibacillus chibensis]MEC0373295.1 AAA family ATPase [Paenibacillus chibensis]